MTHASRKFVKLATGFRNGKFQNFQFCGKGCRCGLERPATRVIGGQESMVIQMNNEYCLVNILKTLTTFYFLDALASLGSMLESQSVIHVFEILSILGHIIRLSSGYVQGMFRVC